MRHRERVLGAGDEMNKGLSGESTTTHNTRYEVRVFSLTQILKISLYFNGIFKTSHIGKTLCTIIFFLIFLDLTIRPIKSTDFGRVEQLIKDAILETNAKDYSSQVVDFMLQVDPFRPRDTHHERDYFVTVDEDIHGVIGLKDNEVKTFFVDPKYHGKGIGSSLLSHIESLIFDRGFDVSKVYSSVSAKSFYEKQGYSVIREDSSPAGKGTMLRYYMEKKLRKK